MVRYAIQYGGIMGVLCFALFILFYSFGLNPLGNISWLGAWIPVMIICMATKAYRENELEGFISYGQAYRIGILTSAAGGLLSALLIFIFCTIYDSSIVDEFKNQTLAQMDEVEKQMKSMMGDSLYQNAVDAYEKISLQTIVSNEFFNKVLCGVFVSIITAAIFKRDKPFINPPTE